MRHPAVVARSAISFIHSFWRLRRPFGRLAGPSADQRVKAEALISRRPARHADSLTGRLENFEMVRNGRGSWEICAKREAAVPGLAVALLFAINGHLFLGYLALGHPTITFPPYVFKSSRVALLRLDTVSPVCRLSGVDMILTNVLSPLYFFPSPRSLIIFPFEQRGVLGNISPYFVTNFH